MTPHRGARWSAQWLIAVLSFVAVSFGALGIPLVSPQGMMIRVPWLAGAIPADPADTRWQAIPPVTLPLSGQVITRPVWPEPTVRALSIRAVHNGAEIAFRLEWEDNTKNDRLSPGTFRDGAAIGLPLGE